MSWKLVWDWAVGSHGTALGDLPNACNRTCFKPSPCIYLHKQLQVNQGKRKVTSMQSQTSLMSDCGHVNGAAQSRPCFLWFFFLQMRQRQDSARQRSRSFSPPTGRAAVFSAREQMVTDAACTSLRQGAGPERGIFHYFSFPPAQSSPAFKRKLLADGRIFLHASGLRPCSAFYTQQLPFASLTRLPAVTRCFFFLDEELSPGLEAQFLGSQNKLGTGPAPQPPCSTLPVLGSRLGCSLVVSSGLGLIPERFWAVLCVSPWSCFVLLQHHPTTCSRCCEGSRPPAATTLAIPGCGLGFVPILSSSHGVGPCWCHERNTSRHRGLPV